MSRSQSASSMALSAESGQGQARTVGHNQCTRPGHDRQERRVVLATKRGKDSSLPLSDV